MNQNDSNKSNTSNVSAVRPLAAKQSRELTPAETSKVGGGWPSSDEWADRQLVR